jgi:hypothetical protein
MPRRPVINYKKIAHAIEYYQMKGYGYIEVPWLVSLDSVLVTKPPEAHSYDTFAGSLVASGEQSFIEIRRELCPGRKYQCATPCFRDEKYDKFHLPQFFKVELIIPIWEDDDPEKVAKVILDDAMSFVRHYHSSGNAVSLVKTDIGWDINVDDIEVGSYGWREHDGFRWAYGLVSPSRVSAKPTTPCKFASTWNSKISATSSMRDSKVDASILSYHQGG